MLSINMHSKIKHFRQAYRTVGDVGVRETSLRQCQLGPKTANWHIKIKSFQSSFLRELWLYSIK